MSSEFGFQELSEVFRTEMYSNPLANVRKDLYKVMADLLTSMRRECFRLESADPESLMLLGARDRRAKAETMVKSICVNRAHKVYLKALRSADGMEMQLDCLTPEEERYYYEVLAANRRQLGIVTDYMNPDEPEYHLEEEPFDTVQDDSVLVRILEDLPDFVGTDRTYTLSKEDVVTLPKEIAEALVKGSKAVEININNNYRRE